MSRYSPEYACAARILRKLDEVDGLADKAMYHEVYTPYGSVRQFILDNVTGLPILVLTQFMSAWDHLPAEGRVFVFVPGSHDLYRASSLGIKGANGADLVYRIGLAHDVHLDNLPEQASFHRHKLSLETLIAFEGYLGQIDTNSFGIVRQLLPRPTFSDRMRGLLSRFTPGHRSLP